MESKYVMFQPILYKCIHTDVGEVWMIWYVKLHIQNIRSKSGKNCYHINYLILKNFVLKCVDERLLERYSQ